jgi:sugar phosphate isomerase/epimerase
VPGHPNGNLHDVPEDAFLRVVDEISQADLRIECFGSAIANGSKSIEQPFDSCWDETRRAAQRMPKLGCKFIRVMSYPIRQGKADQMEEERFRRLREIQRIISDAGATVVHENCNNYGGMGWTYTQKLLENVPGLMLAFDTGNCVFDLDYTKPEPHPHQSTWEFYTHIREHIAHLHVKDGILTPGGKRHTYPGEGNGAVKRVLEDLLATGYSGAISIEPHMGIAPEFKDSLPPAEGRYQTYLTYGKRLQRLLSELSLS